MSFKLRKTWSLLHYFGERICVRGLIFAICTLMVSANALGSNIQVTNTNTSGAGSLDQAIQDFIAGGTSGTISFDPSLTGSTIMITAAYSLSANSLVLDGDVDDDGVSDITLQSDASNHRFFSLSGTAAFTLSHVQIENFSSTSDGGVFNVSDGTLTIENSTIKNNSARSGGVFYMTKGNVNISKSIFSGNSSTSQGGVIYQFSFVGSVNTTVENSLFFGNSSPNSNGGVAYLEFGSTLTLRHVTLASNSSKHGGGAIFNSATLTAENCLFVDNSSETGKDNIESFRGFNNTENILGGENGVSNDVANYFVDATNGDYSLIAESPAVNAGLNSLTTAAGITTDILGNPTPYDGITDLVDAGAYEFQGDPPISFESEAVINSNTMTVTLTFDRQITGLDNTDFSTQAGDLSLTSLTTPDNVAYTATFNLSDLTEKVIDTVFMDALVEDLFMNSLQAQGTFAYVFYVPVAHVTNTQTSGEGSLDQALQDFIDSQGIVNTVEFDPSLSGSTIMVTKNYGFTQGTLLINGDIDDDGTIDITVQSDGQNHGLFNVNGSTSLTLNKTRVIDFSPSSQWGPVAQVNSNAASLIVTGCDIRNNSTGGIGGPIYCQNGNVSIKQTIFSDNSATWGGAVTIYSGGTTIIENSLFEGNSANTGGAIYGRNGANITVRHCTFSDNSSTGNGGAIYNLRILKVENSLFVANTAGGTGDNIQNDSSFDNVGGNILGGEEGASNDVTDYFTDATTDDYTLHLKSLAADLGVNSLATDAGITSDLLGNARPFSGAVQVVDVGAYELQADPDFVSPSVSITTTSTNPTNDNPIPITITFDETVVGFESGDLTMSGGTIDNFTGSGATYTFDLIPSSDGTLTVDIAANVAKDVAGNENTSATQFSIQYDGTLPSVSSITISTGFPNFNYVEYLVTFDENVNNLSADDFTATIVSGTVTGTVTDVIHVIDGSYFVSISSLTGTGSVRLDFNASTDVIDERGNGNGTNGHIAAFATGEVQNVDRDSPTLVISSTATDPTNASTFPISLTFSEEVTGLQASELNLNNGDLSNFTTLDNITFTGDVTPTADGTITIDVGNSVAFDNGSNGNIAATQFSIESDQTQPTPVITSSATSPTNNNPIPVMVTFDESVTGFESDDLTISGGTVSNFIGSGSTYTFDLTPLADGTLTVDIANNSATDAAGNDNTAASQLSIDYDGTVPTVVITSNSSDATSDNPIPVTVTFSESVTGFESGDLSVAGGSVTAFTGSGSIYTFDLVPTGEGTLTVDIGISVAIDAAGNENTSASQLSIEYDVTNPTVSISTTSSNLTNDNPIPVMITFSELVTGFESADLTISGGTLNNFTGSGASYSFDLIPDADGTLTVDIGANIATDAASNLNTVATQLSVDYDGTTPTVSLATTSSSPTNNNSIPVTITFNESVAGFESTDLAISGGMLNNFTGSGASYSFDLIPDADGTLTVDIAANVATDAANNGNTVAAQLSVDYDGTEPTVSLATTSSSPTNNNSIPVTITFNESVTGFESTDLTISGGTLNNFTGSGANYSFDLIPDADGTLTVDVSANVASDVANNGNTTAAQLSVEYDSTAPIVSMATTASSPTNGNPIPVTISFSESVTGFESTDLTISGGTLNNFIGSEASYSFDLIPDADGTLMVDIAANVTTDAANNGNAVATPLSLDYDGTMPTVSIATSSSSPTNNNSIPVTVTFSESVTGFESTDVAISGGTLNNFTGSGASYSFDLIPDADGTLMVDIAANVTTDAANNGNTVAAQLSVEYDSTTPTVSIATASSSPTNDNPIPVTITFDESVTGFESTDVMINGGSITNFSGSGANYSFDLVPVADGTLTVDVSANVATDAANNGNTAGTQLSVDYDGTAPTVSIVTTSSSPTNSNAIPVTVTFSETVTGFESIDLTIDGGSITNFTGSGVNYSFDLIPDADGTLTVDVFANVATDAANNGNTKATQLSVDYDGTAPSVSIATTTSPTNSNSIPVTVTFNETVTEFESTDLTISGGSISNFAGVGSNYTFDLVPDVDGRLTVDISANVATDAANNGNTEATQLSVDYDGTAPSVSIATTSTSPTNSNSIPVTITFSESVTGFESTDVTINGGSITNFLGSGTSYSFDLVPDADGTLTVDVPANVATDVANNGNTEATQLSVDYDGTAPSVSMATTSTSPTNSNSIPVTVTFSETVTGFESTDLTISGGSISNFIGSETSYSFDLIPDADGTLTVDVPANVATDVANNGNTEATQLSVDYDGTAPSVSMATTSTSPTNSNSIPVTVTFSETVTGFESTDVVINGGSISNFTGSGTSYSFDIIPHANGTLTVDVPANVATDAANNGNTEATQLSVDYDGTAPSVSIATTSTSPTNSNSIPVTVTFSETVTGFESTDLTISGGSISNFIGSETSYSFDLIPDADGTLTVDVPANVATDVANNGNTEATQLSVDYDGTAPSVSMATTSTSPTNSNSIPVTVTFSETVTGFESTDVTINGGSITNFLGAGTSYSFDLVPDADGTLTVDVPANVATDAANNDNTEATQLSVDYDGTAPSVSIATTSISPTNSNSIPVTITFNESVTGFESTDVTISGGSISNFTSVGANYTFDLVPGSDGTLTVDVPANVATDAANNGNTEATQLSVDYDGTAPSVNIATTSTSPTNSNSIPVTITFSESVTGFESTDVTVSGGSISNFQGVGANYTFDLVPDADGRLTVDISANVATDAANNGNAEATQLSVDYDGSAPSVSIGTTITSPTNSNSIPVTITFSESVTGFESTDITINGGSISNFQGVGANYTFDLIPNADGTLMVDISANVAIDAANNGNAEATQLSVDYDGTAPSVSIATTSTSPTNSNSIPVTVTFSESVTGFESTDITINGGSISNFQGVGANYTFDIIPDSDGTLTVDVSANVATDEANNGNTVATQLSIDYDGSKPSVSIATTSTSPTNSNSIPVAITFSETVTGFESTDLTISGATLNNFTGSGTSYSFDLIPSTDGTLTVDIAANVVTDEANNGNTAAAQLTIEYDGSAPTVIIATTVSSPTNNNPIPVTIAFSEAVTGFESADVKINGGSITNFTGSGANYSLDIVPVADGILTVDIAANVGIDASDNGNTVAEQLSVEYDGTAPTVNISTSSNTTNNNPIPVTITFSETVTGFESTDITINDGSITNFTGSGTSYSFDLIPSTDGTLTVDLAANLATDMAGNGNTEASQLNIEYDATAPNVTVDELNTDDRTPEITGTVDDPEAIILVMVDGQTATAINNGDGTWIVLDNTLSAIEIGTYDVVATATDVIQNVGLDNTTDELTINEVLGVKKENIELSIFPNPTTDLLSISTNFDHREIRSIQIFNASGSLMIVPYSHTQFDVRGLSIGQYFLRIQVGDTLVIKKFIKN